MSGQSVSKEININPPPALFSDVAETTGLDFAHFNGMTGKMYLPEIMGAGSAMFDFDNDGDLDVFLVQGKMLDPDDSAKAVFPWTSKTAPTGRLFRNDLTLDKDGKPILKFVDVTVKSKIVADGYGFGIAVGDIKQRRLQ